MKALFQAEATYVGHAKTFLQDVKKLIQTSQSISLTGNSITEILGPVPAFYTKKAGKFRYQLYVQSEQRKELHDLLRSMITDAERLKSAGRVRWRLEVDPTGD